jgi:ABC-type phosphate transport system substrate-binding protein
MGNRILILWHFKNLKTMKKYLTMLLACLSAGVFSGLCPIEKVTHPDGGIVVIVSKENPIGNLSAGEVKMYYLRKIKKRWPELNKNIRPVDRKSKCAEQDTFFTEVLGMTATEVEQYFVNKQLQNAERPQDKFATEADVINFVAEEPGAIGYIKASSVSAEVKAKVKIIFTLQ